MNDSQYIVYGVGSLNRESQLGVYDDLSGAQKRIREIHDRGHMVYYDRVDIVKVTEEVVETTSESEPQFENLQDQLYRLEERHVGLRHEMLYDIEDIQDDVLAQRNELALEIFDRSNDRDTLRMLIADLQEEVANLRSQVDRR